MVNFPQKSTDHYGTENILSIQVVVDFSAMYFKKFIIIRQLNQKKYIFLRSQEHNNYKGLSIKDVQILHGWTNAT